jgi:hypothetical protein
MPQGQGYTDAPLTPDQVKTAAYTDAPLPPPPQGYWEDRGIAGKMWHPPGVAPGLDPTSHRADTSVVSNLPVIGDITPEMLVGGMKLPEAVVGAVRGTVGAASRAAAAVSALGPYAAPYVKYKVAHGVLTAMGVPGWAAEIVAFGASGYRGRGGGAAAAEAEAAAGGAPPTDPAAPHLDRSVPVPPSTLTPQQLRERVFYGQNAPPPAVEKPPLGARAAATASAPTGPSQPPPPVLDPEAQAIRDQTAPFSATPGARPASPPAAPAPPADLGTPAPASTSPAVSNWSPQRIRNEVGLAARRAKLSLSDDQLAQADALVRQGQSPPSAVRSVAPPPKLKVTAAEMGLYTNLRQRGLTQAQAMETVAAQRQLAQSLGTPSSEAIRQAVEQRNLTGRWDE